MAPNAIIAASFMRQLELDMFCYRYDHHRSKDKEVDNYINKCNNKTYYGSDNNSKTMLSREQ